jgi:hypothetical protein
MHSLSKKKSNILTILYPYKKGYNPLCLISFYLSSYIPSKHPGFHKKQLTNLIKKAIEIINTLQIKSYDIVIAGDTNYRITNRTIKNINLKHELIYNQNLKKKLKNVCDNKCQNKYTHDYSCIHDKYLHKKLVSAISYFFNKTKLDLMLTNLNVKSAKINNKLCNISDHSMILAQLEYKTNKTNIKSDDTLSKQNDE